MSVPGLGAFRRLMWMVASSELVPTKNRYRALRRLGLSNVEPTTILPGVIFALPSSVTAGPGCYFARGTFFDAGPVILGRNVYFGPGVKVITGNHPIGGPQQRAADGKHETVSIGDGAWLGAGVIVLPGVTVGAGCVIGAGAVVRSDCGPNGLYVGVPARRIRDLPTDESAAE